MLICSGIYAVWQRANRPAPAREETAAEVPSDRLPHNQAPPPEASQTPATQAPPAENAMASPPQQNPAQQNPAPCNPPPAIPGAQPSATPPPQPSAPRVATPPSNPNAPVRVTVTADELFGSWPERTANILFRHPGSQPDPYVRRAKAMYCCGWEMPGASSIMLNGKPVGAVGPKAQVRTVQFTSGGFQIVAVPKPSLPLNDLL